jgi:hypothetical protein
MKHWQHLVAAGLTLTLLVLGAEAGATVERGG